ncbi:hypothetical protein HDU76_000329 [Blyttiomyces sp. JEL0837]|nr:hypothetical protein HDU76_000329 [Blyttiomyces sp. JEL0837]
MFTISSVLLKYFEIQELKLMDYTEGLPKLNEKSILTEGVDIPRVDCVMLARPTRSSVLLQQMIGRGIRRFTSPDGIDLKPECLVVDFVDSVKDGSFIATVPSLLGLNSNSDVPKEINVSDYFSQLSISDNESLQVNEDAESEANEDAPPNDQLSQLNVDLKFREFSMDTIFNAAGLEEENNQLGLVSRFAWTRVGPCDFVLVLPNNESLLVRKEGDLITGVLRKKRKGSKGSHYSSDTHLGNFDSATTAITSLDTWVKTNKRNLMGMLSRNAAWRKLPASDQQLEFIRKRNIASNIQDLNRGQASIIINRYIFGAKGRATKVHSENNKKKKRYV